MAKDAHERKQEDEFTHVSAIHNNDSASPLSSDYDGEVSFRGFRVLGALVLIVGNLRLALENLLKYGVLMRLGSTGIPVYDLKLTALLTMLIPLHLFFALAVELVAARAAKGQKGQEKRIRDGSQNTTKTISRKVFRESWRVIALIHSINAASCLMISTWAIYNWMWHPLPGIICQIHAVILCLKVASFALTNRDLRDAYLSNAPSPKAYAPCPYPTNVSISNVMYYWWAPTLIYQPVYPRSTSIRLVFLMKRLAELIVACCLIYILIAQYASPLLRNAIAPLRDMSTPKSHKILIVLERVLKLSTISLLVWLVGFYAVFHSLLNALAEVLRFGSRDFYLDWWNSGSMGTFWRTWNRPVYHYFKRHILKPLILKRGWSARSAGVVVFFFSAILHELVVGVPCHSVNGTAFLGIMFQSVGVIVTQPLEKSRLGATIGSIIFWSTFCLLGQPTLVVIYFLATWDNVHPEM